MHSDIDVLICGAGAAGLTLAIDLARRGVSFRLIEKREAPFHGSRGKGIQPRTLELLDDLGLVERIVAAGGPYPVQRIHHADGSHVDSELVEQAEPTPSEPYAQPLMLPQFLTERLLRERLAEWGRQPDFGCELIGFQLGDDAVIATLAGPDGTETVRARYLVGTDGGRSLVRQQLGIGFPGKTLPVRAIVADVALQGLARDAWHRFQEGSMERQIGICPLVGTDLFQIQAPIPLEGEIDLSVTGLQQMLVERTGRSDLRIDAVSWASAYRMNARLADRYRIGRVFLAGDAAHIHPPTGGQGLNTSMQDAYNLGWKLAAVLAGAPDDLLDSYDIERRPIAAEMLGLSTRLLKDAGRGEMRRGREVNQLDLGYLESPLALDPPDGWTGLPAGARVPDAQIRRADGSSARVFDLLRGPHWTLLGMAIERPAFGPSADLRVHVLGAHGDVQDSDDQVTTGYGLSPGYWMLIRPDGYLGGAFAETDIGPMQAFLARVGVRLAVDAAAVPAG